VFFVIREGCVRHEKIGTPDALAKPVTIEKALADRAEREQPARFGAVSEITRRYTRG
jgi:hypothetical protein